MLTFSSSPSCSDCFRNTYNHNWDQPHSWLHHGDWISVTCTSPHLMEPHLQWTAWEDPTPHFPYECGCWGKPFLHCGTTHILVQGNQIHRLWTWLSCPDITHSRQSSSGTLEVLSSASSHCKIMLPLSGSDWFDDTKYRKYVSVTWTGEYRCRHNTMRFVHTSFPSEGKREIRFHHQPRWHK